MFAYVQRRICKIQALSREGQQKGGVLGCCLWRKSHWPDSLLGQPGHGLMAGTAWLPASMPSGGSKRQSATVFKSPFIHQLGLSISDNIYSLQLLCYSEDHRLVNKDLLGTTTCSVLCYILWGTGCVRHKRSLPSRSLQSFLPKRINSAGSTILVLSYEVHRRGTPAHSQKCCGETSAILLLPRAHPSLGEKEGWLCVAWNILSSLSSLLRAPLLSCIPQCKTVRLPLCQEACGCPATRCGTTWMSPAELERWGKGKSRKPM